MLPSPFDKFFQVNKELREYKTRGSEKIHSELGRTNYNKYTTRNKGYHIWNKLPIEILQSYNGNGVLSPLIPRLPPGALTDSKPH